jgi:hypothetical protein
MISRWNIESTLNKDPGTLSAYHLCHGDIITKVQLREWIWAPDGFDGYFPALCQKGRDPLKHGYRGKAWISTDEQMELIEEYVELTNDKRMYTTGCIFLRSGEHWQDFQRHIQKARLSSRDNPCHMESPRTFAIFKKSVAVDRCS